VDGDYQTFKAKTAPTSASTSSAATRAPAMVEDWSDEDDLVEAQARRPRLPQGLRGLQGGDRAQGQPTVILAKTIKGYGLGTHFAGRNATHQMKKLTLEDLKAFRDSLRSRSRRAARGRTPTCRRTTTPAPRTRPHIKYMLERRAKLGGSLPSARRKSRCCTCPTTEAYARTVKKGSGKQEVATTMAFVRLLKDLMRDKEIGPRIVPIIPDEARTFGMDSCSRRKIYNPHGSTTPGRPRADARLQGVGRGGRSCTRGSTRRARRRRVHRRRHVVLHARRADDPVYIFYSMFGFQRTGDSILGGRRPDGAAASSSARPRAAPRSPARACSTPTATRRARLDQPGRGGLRPGLRLRDRAHRAGRSASDVRRGLRERLYYLTVYNEPMPQPAEPDGRRRRGDPARHAPVVTRAPGDGPRVQLLASGVGVPWAMEAAGTAAFPATGVWPPTSGR
jgi:pyruvate dehydrogenase E1 component